MKLKNYIKKEIEKGRREFDIGVEPIGKNLIVNENSLNKIRFIVKHKK